MCVSQIQAGVMRALSAIKPTSKYAELGNYVAWQAPLSYTVTRALQVQSDQGKEGRGNSWRGGEVQGRGEIVLVRE